MLLCLIIFLFLELSYLVSKFIVIFTIFIKSILSFITFQSRTNTNIIINLIFFIILYGLLILNIYIYIYISIIYCIYLLLNKAYITFLEVLNKIIILLLVAFFLGQISLFSYFNIIIFYKIFFNLIF